MGGTGKASRMGGGRTEQGGMIEKPGPSQGPSPRHRCERVEANAIPSVRDNSR